MSTIVWKEAAITIAGTAINVRTSKAEDAKKPPLFIFHRDIGTLDRQEFYDLLAVDRDVIVPDHPGFGRSPRPAWVRSVRDIAVIYRQLIAAMGVKRHALLGLGLGGWIASELATMSSADVTGMALVGAMGVQPPSGYILDQAMVDYIQYVSAGFHKPEAFAGAFGAEVTTDQLEQWDLCREMCFRIAWKPYMYSQSLPHLVSGLSMPAAVVWGEHDRIVPISAGEVYAKALSTSVQVIPGTGHHVEIEAPQDLARIVQATL